MKPDRTYSWRENGEQVKALGLCEREIVLAAAESGVPVAMLYAIGLSESGRKGKLEPFALNIDGRSVFPKSMNHAIEHLRSARDKKAKFIDLGCMQLNVQFHRHNFNSDLDMLDPRNNVRYAARFLARLRIREGTWSLAIARYHAGAKNYPAHRRYICRVTGNLVLAGFGAWTHQAKQFCSSVTTRSTQ